MNILIVTPFYKQDGTVGSIRWTNIAQRLSKRHNIIIVTQPLNDEMSETSSIVTEDGIVVARLNQKSLYEKIAIRHFHGATHDDLVLSDGNSCSESRESDTATRKLKNAALYASMRTKAKEYARRIKSAVIPDHIHIDIVISSSCPIIEMMIGYEIKRLLGCKWISDFRDLPYIEEKNDDAFRVRRIMLHDIKSADAIVSIARKGKEQLIKEGIVFNDNTYVIPNGYSTSDRINMVPRKRDGVLYLAHTGSLYGGRRKPDSLFRVMHKLCEEHQDVKIHLDVAGGNTLPLLEKAKKYHVEDMVTDYGFLTRNDAIKLQGTADCLVVLADSRPGSLAAKIFEYTLCEKPIVCITCSAMIDSDESEYVNRLGLGLAIEEARGEGELQKLYEYLLLQAQRKSDGKALVFNPNYSEFLKYDYDSIAAQYEELCKRVVSI